MREVTVAEPTYTLEVHTVGSYLARKGLILGDHAEAEPLPGGVSNKCLLVLAQRARLVVKQALPRLRVAEEWFADPTRSLIEADALRFAASICAESVPEVLAVVPEDYLLVMEAAPEEFVVWKQQLLEGDVDLGVARRVGRYVGLWHAATYMSAEALKGFPSLELFSQLRLEPFYRAVTPRHPDLARKIDELAESLTKRRFCLVHGDLSPKNVLTYKDKTWLIDWEVAHFGDPAFDLAFMLCHLRCKALHLKEAAGAFRECAAAFLESYRATAPEVAARTDDDYLARQIACIMLARVDGKSPVDYLDGAAKTTCRRLAHHLLLSTNVSVDDVWER